MWARSQLLHLVSPTFQPHYQTVLGTWPRMSHEWRWWFVRVLRCLSAYTHNKDALWGGTNWKHCSVYLINLKDKALMWLVRLVEEIPYNGKLSREKTFSPNFAVLWPYAKVFSAKFGAWCPLALQKRAIRESFLPRKFPTMRYSPHTQVMSTLV